MADNLPNLKKILARVQVHLADHFYEKENETLEDLETSKVIRRPFSIVAFLRARTSKDVWRLVMKTTVHHPDNRTITDRENQAVVEYNILKHLYLNFQKVKKCSVPQPILVIPKIETYIMEFAEGNLLSDEHRYTRYLSSRKGFDVLREYYFCCGKWLKHFQEFTGFRNVGSDALSGLLERCDEMLRKIEEIGDPRCPKNIRGKVMEILYDQLLQLSKEKILVSGRHGDFGPWNILAGPNGITVIDFLGYQEGPIAVDLLETLVFFENERLCLTSSPSRIDILRKSFLEGYSEIPYVPVPLLRICEARPRIESLFVNISDQKRRLHHRIQLGLCVKAHIGWLSNEGMKNKLLWPAC